MTPGRRAPAPDDVERLADELHGRPRGLIVCGPQDDPGLPSAVARLASSLGYPILADPLSGVRYGPHDRSHVLDAYDAFLRLPALTDGLVPEVVLAMGAMPTSKPLLQYLAAPQPAALCADRRRRWLAGSGQSGDARSSTAIRCCCATLSLLDGESRDGPWLTEWTSVDRATRRNMRCPPRGSDRGLRGQRLPSPGAAAAGRRDAVRRQQHASTRPGHVPGRQRATLARALESGHQRYRRRGLQRVRRQRRRPLAASCWSSATCPSITT